MSEHNTPILPTDRMQALTSMINATQSLLNLVERESQALVQNDMMNFGILQEEKTFLAKRFEKLSAEFRERLTEFRGVDRGLLDRLESLQKQLGEKSEANNLMVLNIYNNSKRKTENSLLTVQELGQQKPVSMDLVDSDNQEQKQANGGA